jgi:hypothetical protein
MTCRDEVLSAAQALTRQSPQGEFTLEEILRLLRAQGTHYKESTIRTHVASRMCANAPDNHGTTYKDLQRLGPNRYRLNRGAKLERSSPTENAKAAAPDVKATLGTKNHDVHALSEDEIKQVLNNWLQHAGWDTHVAWGHTPGIDIEAKKPGRRWVIEVKGPGSRPPMRVNYFLAILGETLQRMDDKTAEYSIALPDLAQYRGLWERLPDLAKLRTRISAIFVDANGKIDHTLPHQMEELYAQ